MPEQLRGKPIDHIEKGELLRLSGMSPGELRRWVMQGIFPRWCARSFQGGGGSRSYYPAWALQRARDIKRLRSEGVCGQRLRKVLRQEELELSNLEKEKP